MQYIITAYDGTDKDALTRRMNARPHHLDNIQKVKEYGSVICAGGIINEEGKPIGSFLILEFASKELFDKYLNSEPYIKEKVWEKVKVENCNVVIKDDVIVGK